MTAIAKTEPQALEQQKLMRPIASPADVLAALDETRAMLAKALQDRVDFGVIPGTSNKRVLLKPGAEKIAFAFGCRPRFTIVDSLVDPQREFTFSEGKTRACIGVYRFVIRCELVRHDGSVVGEGIGSCSTLESKYRSRPHDCENTALKMAEKRAFVAVVLTTFGLSEAFTQDLEDLEEVATPVTRPITERPIAVIQAAPKERTTASIDADIRLELDRLCIGIGLVGEDYQTARRNGLMRISRVKRMPETTQELEYCLRKLRDEPTPTSIVEDDGEYESSGEDRGGA